MSKKTRDEPLPSREDVDFLCDFLNTAHRPPESGDALATAVDLARWLARRGLADATTSIDAGDLQNAHELRRGLRELVRRRGLETMSAQAIQRLNDAAGSHLSAVRFEVDGTAHRIFLDSGWARFRSRLLETSLALINGPRWPRFKYCTGCDNVFYDESRNQAATWCSQQCGNRMSSRSWRRRHPDRAKQKSRRANTLRIIRNLPYDD